MIQKQQNCCEAKTIFRGQPICMFGIANTHQRYSRAKNLGMIWRKSQLRRNENRAYLKKKKFVPLYSPNMYGCERLTLSDQMHRVLCTSHDINRSILEKHIIQQKISAEYPLA